jgi:long-chain acyl-CoA synthetase
MMVVMVNRFELNSSPEEFEQVWKSSSEFMRRQPGFINFRLLRSLRRPDVYVNIAFWESAEDHQRALGSDEFQAHVRDLAAVAKAEPDLYSVVFDGEPANR